MSHWRRAIQKRASIVEAPRYEWRVDADAIPWRMLESDPYASWPLSDRLQMLAFEAELGHLPRSLISAIWETRISPQMPPGESGRRWRASWHR